MNPGQLAAANAFFDSSQEADPIGALGNSLKDVADQIGMNSKDVKTAVAAVLAKSATGGNILTRKTGQVVNPNMELLFGSPTLRPFSFTYRMSPRDYEEAEMVKKIIRMFKQSMAVKRTPSQLFLKSPNTYALRWLTAGNREHSWLPKIKECALTTFSVNYTPDGNYATYENSSMVAYELQFGFQELEPIYHDNYTALDQDRDESIGF